MYVIRLEKVKHIRNECSLSGEAPIPSHGISDSMDTHSQYNTIRYRACTHISLKCMQTHVNTAYLHLFFMKS